MQPILKPPGPALLKLRYDGPLSYSAFKVNLRHYTLASTRSRASAAVAVNNLNAGVPAWSAPPDPLGKHAARMSGVDGRPLFVLRSDPSQEERLAMLEAEREVGQ